MPAYPLIPAPSPVFYLSVSAPYLLEHRPLFTLRWSEPESRLHRHRGRVPLGWSLRPSSLPLMARYRLVALDRRDRLACRLTVRDARPLGVVAS